MTLQVPPPLRIKTTPWALNPWTAFHSPEHDSNPKSLKRDGLRPIPCTRQDWKPDKWGNWETDWGQEPGCGAKPDGKGGWKGRDDIHRQLASYHDIGNTPDQGSPDLWSNSRVDNANL